jgi:hypothetical protein
MYSRTPLIRKLVIWILNYPDRFGPAGKFIENSIKLICLEITGYRIKFSAVLWLINFKSGVVETFRRRDILYLVTAELQTVNVA